MNRGASREEVVITTCPRDCYDSCGMIAIKRDGVVAAVRGNPAHPVSRGTLCGKCSTAYNREWRDPARRLTQPMRRCGPKGQGRYEPVSWETAIAEIAARVKRIVRSRGARAILNAHYTGTISLLAGVAPMRFFNRLGATEVTPDTICNMAGHVALRYMYGTSVDGFDPRAARDARCIVVWGANPHASAPHAHDHWLPEAPGQVIVVDPVRTPTAAQADIHLQPFPGSDAALAFAMLHVIHRDGLIDRGFIAAHVKGWEELESAIAACDLAKLSALTGVPAALTERAAHLYAAGPSLLWLGQGLQRQTTGGNVMRACALLPALTGNLCKPGAGFLYLNANLRQRGMDEDYLTGVHLAEALPPAVSHMDLAAVLQDPARSQALFVWNMNPLASCPQQARLRRALEREDLLTVVLELFPTDTAALADYVLPAASFLEFDDLIASYFHLTLLRAGQSDAAARRCAAESGDLSTPGGRPRFYRAGTLRERRRHAVHAAVAQRARARFRIAGGEGHDLGSARAGRAVRRRGVCDAERAHRDLERARGGGRLAAAAAVLERSASGGRPSAPAVAGAPVAAQHELRQCGQDSRPAGAGDHCTASRGCRGAAAGGRRCSPWCTTSRVGSCCGS